MRPWRVTIVLLLATVAIGGTFFRGLQDVYRLQFEPFRLMPTKAALDRVRDRNAGDAQIALGYAAIAAQRWRWQGAYKMWRKELPSYKPEPGWKPGVAFAEAVRLAEDDPVPRLYYALSLLDACGLRADTSPNASDEHWRPAPRTPQEEQALEHVFALLTEAAALDPRNAFSHYLLAYVAFARSDDDEALREIAVASECPVWTVYQDKVGLAVWRVLDASGASGLTAASDAATTAEAASTDSNSAMRNLSRILQGQAEQRRLAGDHERALTYYAFILKLARTIRMQATEPMQSLTGRSVLSMAVGSLVSRQERKRLFSSVRGDDRWERIRLAEAEAFAAYARQHGRPELGTLAVAETQAYSADENRTRAALKRYGRDPAAKLVNVLRTALKPVACQAALLVAALLVCGIILLGSCVYRRWRAVSVISGGAWALGLGALLAVPIAASVWYALFVSEDLPEAMRGFNLLLVYALSCCAGVGWLTAAGLLIRGRTRSSGADDPAQRPSGIGTFALALAPTIAAQLLALVLFLLIMYFISVQDAHLAARVLSEGELRVLGIR